jgi:hypothetical protein
LVLALVKIFWAPVSTELSPDVPIVRQDILPEQQIVAMFVLLAEH